MGSSVKKMMSLWIVFFLAAAVMGGISNEKKKKAFDKMDLNGDGMLTLDELQKFLTKMFYNADVNKNGEIDWEEFIQIHSVFRSGLTKKQLVARFNYEDLDGNKKVTLSELMQVAKRDFAQAALSRDGKVTFDEFKKFKPSYLN